MKKYLWIFIFLVLIIGICFFVWNKTNINQESVDYTAEKTSTNLESNKIRRYR